MIIIKKGISRQMLFVMGMMISVALFSASKKKNDSSPPLGCRDLGYKFELKLLKLDPESAGAPQSMYFVYNKLDQRVKLYHLRDGDAVHGMHLNHSIVSKRWAVFATSEKEIKFTCTVAHNKSRYGKIINCKDALKVCEYNNVKFGMNNRGNLWIVNSNTRNGAVRGVVRYGIIPAQ